MIDVVVEYNNQKYEFTRDEHGRGMWTALTGRRKNVIVPLELSSKLQALAVSGGSYSKDVFSNFTSSEFEKKTVKTAKKTSAKAPAKEMSDFTKKLITVVF